MPKWMDQGRPRWAVLIEGIREGAETSGDRGGGRAAKGGSRGPKQ